MNIAIFSDFFYPELSGVSESIVSTGTELGKRGHQVDFFVPAYGKKEYAKAGILQGELHLGQNVTIHRVTSLPVQTPNQQGRMYIPNIVRGFFGKKYDIVHSHGFYGAGIDALCLARVQNIPLIGTNHTLLEAFNQYLPINTAFTRTTLKAYVTWYYNRCDLVSTPSEFLYTTMGPSFVAPHSVVSNPIQDDFFERAGDKIWLKKALGLAHVSFLYVGRLSSEKNVESLITAFIPFARKHADVSLTLIGQGMLRKKIENTIKHSGVENQMHVAGPFLGKHKKTLFDYYHACDAFVMPSTSETQCMNVIEAMASSLPVIAADAAALSEIVGDSRGIMFDPHNAVELEKALESLYGGITERSERTLAALEYAKERSARNIAEEWERIYTRSIAKHTNHGKS